MFAISSIIFTDSALLLHYNVSWKCLNTTGTYFLPNLHVVIFQYFIGASLSYLSQNYQLFCLVDKCLDIHQILPISLYTSPSCILVHISGLNLLFLEIHVSLNKVLGEEFFKFLLFWLICKNIFGIKWTLPPHTHMYNGYPIKIMIACQYQLHSFYLYLFFYSILPNWLNLFIFEMYNSLHPFLFYWRSRIIQ